MNKQKAFFFGKQTFGGDLFVVYTDVELWNIIMNMWNLYNVTYQFYLN